MGSKVGLPAGFTIVEQTQGLPAGFTIVEQPQGFPAGFVADQPVEGDRGGIGQTLAEGAIDVATGIPREVLGAVVGAGQGVGEFGRGVAGLAADLAGSLGIPVDRLRDFIAEEQQAADIRGEELREVAPVGGRVGQFVGEVGAELLPIGAVARGVKGVKKVGQALTKFKEAAPKTAAVLGTIGAGAAAGAVAGATQPTAAGLTPEESLAVRGEQATIGAGIGAAVAPLAPLAGKTLTALRKSPKDASAKEILGVDVVEEGIDPIATISKIQEGLRGTAKNLKQRFGKLYDEAEKLGAETGVTSKSVMDDIARPLEQAARTTIDDDARAIYSNSVARLSEIAERPTISINELQGIRRAATKASAGGGTKGHAAKEVVNTIDEFMDNALEKGQVTGSKEAIGKWQEAIKLRREFGVKFEKPKIVAKAIADGETPERIGANIFGAGSPSNAKDAAKLYNEVVKAAGEDGGAVAADLKRSLVHKMVTFAQRGTAEAGGEPTIWMRGLANEITKLKQNNPSMFKKFTPREQKILTTTATKLRKAEEASGILNKLGSMVIGLINKTPVAKVQLPTTLAPQKLTTLDELINLINTGATTPVKVSPAAAGAVGEELRQRVR